MKVCSHCGEKIETNQARCAKCGMKPVSPCRPLLHFIIGFIAGGLFVLLLLPGFRVFPGKPSNVVIKGIRVKLKVLPHEDPVSHATGEINDEVMREVEQIMMNRLMNENSPVSITNRGNNIISIEIQKEIDMERMKELVSWRGFLEFKEQYYNTSTRTREWRTVLDGSYLRKNGATVGFNAAMKRPYLLFLLNPEGTEKFAEITRRNINLPIGIFMDGKLVDAPVIKEPITGGSGVIEGAGMDRAAFERMKTILNAGFLPAEVKILECRAVDMEPR